MSSPSARSQHYRRRSRSTSSSGHPPSSRFTSSIPWRTARKRTRPASLRSPSYKDLASSHPPEKWDVDVWRRGKRARRSPSPPPAFAGIPFLAADTLSGPQNTTPFSYSFPSTSDAFQFFPERPPTMGTKASRASDVSTHMFDASESLTDMIPADSVDQLRTDAFWELHRSIAESGEGLVSRLRDWEESHSRSRSSVDARRRRPSGSQPLLLRTRKRSLPGQDWSSDSSTEDESEDDDDIQIISGESSSPEVSPTRGPPAKKRAYSLSVMDVDYPVPFNPYSTPESSEQCSSPIDTHFVTVSEAYSDDEHEEGGSSPPALTHAYTNSASSSLISLPLPPPHDHAASLHAAGDSPYLPSTASRTEKAIAALELALANGAGGLSDYEALRAVEDKTSSTLDETLVGEMWH